MRWANLRLSCSYRTLLGLLYAKRPNDNSLVGLFIGFLSSNDVGSQRNRSTDATRFVSIQDRAALSALRKMLLRFCAKQLQSIVWECRNQGVDIEYHPKSRIVAFLLSLVSSAALSGQEIDILVSLGLPAIVLALRKQLAFPLQTQPVAAVQVILDEGVSRRKGGATAGNDNFTASSLSGPEVAAMMKLGVRVVRGPDWKWGDQVSC